VPLTCLTATRQTQFNQTQLAPKLTANTLQHPLTDVNAHEQQRKQLLIRLSSHSLSLLSLSSLFCLVSLSVALSTSSYDTPAHNVFPGHLPCCCACSHSRTISSLDSLCSCPLSVFSSSLRARGVTGSHHKPEVTRHHIPPDAFHLNAASKTLQKTVSKVDFRLSRSTTASLQLPSLMHPPHFVTSANHFERALCNISLSKHKFLCHFLARQSRCSPPTHSICFASLSLSLSLFQIIIMISDNTTTTMIRFLCL
jgi:hypothetical protein